MIGIQLEIMLMTLLHQGSFSFDPFSVNITHIFHSEIMIFVLVFTENHMLVMSIDGWNILYVLIVKLHQACGFDVKTCKSSSPLPTNSSCVAAKLFPLGLQVGCGEGGE